MQPTGQQTPREQYVALIRSADKYETAQAVSKVLLDFVKSYQQQHPATKLVGGPAGHCPKPLCSMVAGIHNLFSPANNQWHSHKRAPDALAIERAITVICQQLNDNKIDNKAALQQMQQVMATYVLHRVAKTGSARMGGMGNLFGFVERLLAVSRGLVRDGQAGFGVTPGQARPLSYEAAIDLDNSRISSGMALGAVSPNVDRYIACVTGVLGGLAPGEFKALADPVAMVNKINDVTALKAGVDNVL